MQLEWLNLRDSEFIVLAIGNNFMLRVDMKMVWTGNYAKEARVRRDAEFAILTKILHKKKTKEVGCQKCACSV